MGRRYDTVSLLTDYGLDDEFVGVLKGVVRDLAPHAAFIDVSHGIRPFDVRAGSLALARAVAWLPEGVVVAVVDPGVGTSRRAIAVEVADGAGVLVGPDNGLLGPAVGVVDGATRAVELTNTEFHLGPGVTFAGRDVFAPVAAHLCNGVDLEDFGDPIDPALLVPGLVPLPRLDADGLQSEVLWVDRFGNCQLNIGPDELAQLVAPPDVVAIEMGTPGGPVERRIARVASTFADLGPGSIGLVLDSQGMYALALDQRSAAAELSLAAGDGVRLSLVDDESATAGGGVAAPAAIPVELRRAP